MNKIKQQNTQLNIDERNNTNNKDEMKKLIWYWVLLIGFIHFLEYRFLLGGQPDELKLPKSAGVSKVRFNKVLNIITKAQKMR